MGKDPGGLAALGFEEAMGRLEQVVRRLESGDATLEESLALFEEGIALARLCQSRLDEAEGRIEKLLDLTADGPVTEAMAPPGEG